MDGWILSTCQHVLRRLVFQDLQLGFLVGLECGLKRERFLSVLWFTTLFVQSGQTGR